MVESIPPVPEGDCELSEWFKKYASVNLREVLDIIKKRNIGPWRNFVGNCPMCQILRMDCSDELLLEAMMFFDPHGDDECYMKRGVSKHKRDVIQHMLSVTYLPKKYPDNVDKNSAYHTLMTLPMSDLRDIVSAAGLKSKRGATKSNYASAIVEFKELVGIVEKVTSATAK